MPVGSLLQLNDFCTFVAKACANTKQRDPVKERFLFRSRISTGGGVSVLLIIPVDTLA
jgi:hypothetical protein